MGYTTDFWGQFSCSPPLAEEHREYLKAFNDTRRMERDSAKAGRLKDDRRKKGGDIS